MISSARTKSDWGMVRPRALAVFRLMTSEIGGLLYREIAWLRPLENFGDVAGGPAPLIVEAGCVRDEAPVLNPLSQRVNRWHPVARCHFRDVRSPCDGDRIGQYCDGLGLGASDRYVVFFCFASLREVDRDDRDAETASGL